MSLTYCSTFCAVEMSVRYGDGDGDANNNDIISCYVHMGLERTKKLSDILDVQHAHMRVINTLIDAMCDHCLSNVWRKHCYRYVKQLLPLLYEMLDQQQYQQKYQEIQTLYAYFFEGNQSKNQIYHSKHSRLPSVKNNLESKKVLNRKKS
jgi:hypothetical protein